MAVAEERRDAGSAGRLCTVEIAKDYLSFSAAHFTIFSGDRRENLHGHNFAVQGRATGRVGENGLTFDYELLKSKIGELCAPLDEKLLLPSGSPHLDIRSGPGEVEVGFGEERLRFLERDVLLIPVANVTVEELSGWFLDLLLADREIDALGLEELEVRVSSGPGQWGISRWRR